jgi:hypothetical protein
MSHSTQFHDWKVGSMSFPQVVLRNFREKGLIHEPGRQLQASNGQKRTRFAEFREVDMGEPTLIHLAIFVISAIVFLFLITYRKQVERTEPKSGAPHGHKTIQPSYCFNDCMRMHGNSKVNFCGAACGLKHYE